MKTPEQSIQLQDLLKFAAFKFTSVDLTTAEMKVFCTLDYDCDVTYASDDIYSELITLLGVIKPLLSVSAEDQSSFEWTTNLSTDFLQFLYYQTECFFHEYTC